MAFFQQIPSLIIFILNLFPAYSRFRKPFLFYFPSVFTKLVNEELSFLLSLIHRLRTFGNSNVRPLLYLLHFTAHGYFLPVISTACILYIPADNEIRFSRLIATFKTLCPVTRFIYLPNRILLIIIFYHPHLPKPQYPLSFQSQCIPTFNPVFSHTFHIPIRTIYQDYFLRHSLRIVQHLSAPWPIFHIVFGVLFQHLSRFIVQRRNNLKRIFLPVHRDNAIQTPLFIIRIIPAIADSPVRSRINLARHLSGRVIHIHQLAMRTAIRLQPVLYHRTAFAVILHECDIIHHLTGHPRSILQ